MADSFLKELNGGVAIAAGSLADADGVAIQQTSSSLVWTTLANIRTFIMTTVNSLLAGKANTSHTHAEADVTGLTSALAGKAAASHAHAAGDITSGTLTPDRLGTGTGLQVVRRNSSNTALEFATISAGGGDVVASNNLSELPDKPQARTNLGLGTAAVLNAPASGNASPTELVKGNDTRLGGGASSDLTAAWTAATVNVTLEGDSIAAGLLTTTLDNYPAFTSGKATLFNVAVSGSYMGTPGEGGNNVYDRYTANVFPKRPAANGGVAGITESWIILMVGTNQIMWNDLTDGVVQGFSTRVANYINRAHTDGFKVAVVTLYVGAGFHDSGGPTAYTNAACDRAAQFNRWFRTSSGADLIVPLDTAIAGISDSAVDGDKCHLSTLGNDRFGKLASDAFRTGAEVKLLDSGMVKGAGADSVATHRSIERTVHMALAAQGHALQVLTPAATTTWDLDSLPFAKLTLTGNTLISPANLRASNAAYSLLIKKGAHTITWDTNVRFRSGTPTLSTTNVYDLLTFWSDGVFLHLIDVELAFDLTIPPPPGVVIEENFYQTGVVVPLHGTAPDTANIPGHLWVKEGYGEFTPGIVRAATGNVGSGGGNSITDGSYIEIDRHDNFSVEWTVVGTYNEQMVFRHNPGNNAYVTFNYDTEYGTSSLYSYDSAGASTQHWFVFPSAFAAGDIIRLTFQGLTVKVYRTRGGTETLLTTQSVGADSNTAAHDKVRIRRSSGIAAFKVKDI